MPANSSQASRREARIKARFPVEQAVSKSVDAASYHLPCQCQRCKGSRLLYRIFTWCSICVGRRRSRCICFYLNNWKLGCLVGCLAGLFASRGCKLVRGSSIVELLLWYTSIELWYTYCCSYECLQYLLVPLAYGIRLLIVMDCFWDIDWCDLDTAAQVVGGLAVLIFVGAQIRADLQVKASQLVETRSSVDQEPEQCTAGPVQDIASICTATSIPECVCCMDRRACFIINGCGHLVACGDCRRRLVYKELVRRGTFGLPSIRTLESLHLENTVIRCPVCRSDGFLLNQHSHGGNVFLP